jgi:hypothetical protein
MLQCSAIKVDIHMEGIAGRSPLLRSIQTNVSSKLCVFVGIRPSSCWVLGDLLVTVIQMASDIAQSGVDISPDDDGSSNPC